MKEKKKKKNEELMVCIHCGAVATDRSQLCRPERFEAERGCALPQRNFHWFPVHGNCQPKAYICGRCGKEALAAEYLCEPTPR